MVKELLSAVKDWVESQGDPEYRKSLITGRVPYTQDNSMVALKHATLFLAYAPYFGHTQQRSLAIWIDGQQLHVTCQHEVRRTFKMDIADPAMFDKLAEALQVLLQKPLTYD